jgi:hypothetical protein
MSVAGPLLYPTITGVWERRRGVRRRIGRNINMGYRKPRARLRNYVSVNLIQLGPLRYFIHISITTPVVSALKNYCI